MAADPLARLRIRTTIAATAVVGTVLLATAAGIVWFVGSSLTAQVRDAAEARAGQVAVAVVSGAALPRPADPEEESVHVVAAGPAPAPTEIEGAYLTVTRTVGAPDGTQRRVVVHRSLDDVADARTSLMRSLAVGVPLVLASVALVTWWVVGAALRPVQEAQARQRRFVSDASHELRSPVAAIRQHAEVTRAHPDTTDAADLAGTVLREVDRLQGLIEDLLLLARLDEGVPQATPHDVDLDDIVLVEAERVRATTTLRVDTKEVGPARVLGRSDHLERMVRNLMDNASEHARTAAALALARADGVVTLRVDDDGPGIAADDRERVLQRFVRLDQARDRRSGGAGLGLSIVQEIAAEHRGSVRVLTSPLGGARLEVRLPAAPEPQSLG
jgi:signal transduction histidine kinase